MSEEKKDWTETMVDLYSEGCSDAEVIKELKITRKQFEQYCADVPKFAELVERGRDYAEAWWLEQGRKAVKEKNNSFPQSLYFNSMANKYGWSNKSDNKSGVEATLNLDRLKEELRKALTDIHKMVNVIEMDPAATRKLIGNG